MIHSTRIIVLNSTKVGEKNLVIHALSRELGRRSFITGVSGSGAKKTGGSMAYWQPLSVL
jgi:hypothetical protein